MMRTTFVKDVYSVQHKSGVRWTVLFHDGTMADTWNDTHGQLLASIAERANIKQRAVRIGTKDTPYGQKLVWAELVDEPERAA